jgi:hypothetical protein
LMNAWLYCGPYCVQAVTCLQPVVFDRCTFWWQP